ncbi:MAG: hypothetical protein HYV19_10840 [Gemmatimonadetes bacterium]|nr:hypothetical protein [Gemmatimonadota bacterium]
MVSGATGAALDVNKIAAATDGAQILPGHPDAGDGQHGLWFVDGASGAGVWSPDVAGISTI